MKKVTVYTGAEARALTAVELRAVLAENYGIVSGISRWAKSALVGLLLDEQESSAKLVPFVVESREEFVGESGTKFVVENLVPGKKAAKVAKVEVEAEDKVNKSDLLRKEIRRRARADQSLNSGELMAYMVEKHEIEMSRQFVVNVRNRYLKACPELLNA